MVSSAGYWLRARGDITPVITAKLGRTGEALRRGERLFSSVACVANSATGKWVSRVGASGGGKAYKKSRPSNYYGILVVIVVLGLATTILARYDYQHPASAASGTPPD